MYVSCLEDLCTRARHDPYLCQSFCSKGRLVTRLVCFLVFLMCMCVSVQVHSGAFGGQKGVLDLELVLQVVVSSTAEPSPQPLSF